MPQGAAAPLGSSFEVIVVMTDTLVLTDGNTNLVVGESGLSGGKNLTLPLISEMVASQNPVLYIANKSSSGGTITAVAATGDSIVGRVTAPVATGLTLRHNGLKTWYGM